MESFLDRVRNASGGGALTLGRRECCGAEVYHLWGGSKRVGQTRAPKQKIRQKRDFQGGRKLSETCPLGDLVLKKKDALLTTRSTTTHSGTASIPGIGRSRNCGDRRSHHKARIKSLERYSLGSSQKPRKGTPSRGHATYVGQKVR